MAIQARPPEDHDYWEGVKDGAAEITEQVGKQIREGIAEANATHDPEKDPDVISRSAMIDYLQGLARRLDEVGAHFAQIIDENNPREES